MSRIPTSLSLVLVPAFLLSTWIPGAAMAPTASAVPASAVLASSALKSGSIEALAVQLNGAKVVSSDGTVVGEVEKVIGGSGTGPQAVLSVGGFLGIGERRVVVPADSLVPSDKEAVRSVLTEAELHSLPEYTE